jgi:hypothetical protein
MVGELTSVGIEALLPVGERWDIKADLAAKVPRSLG